jgi:hypothetical protein
MLLLGLRYLTESDEGTPAGLFRRHTPMEILLDGRLEVGGNFCVKVGIERSTAKYGQ